MARRYEPCTFVTSMYPRWQLCERPVAVEDVRKRDGLARCAEHGALLPYWPTGEAAPDPGCFCKPGAECCCSGAEVRA